MPEMSRPRGSDNPIEILLVEDNPDDIRLIEESFNKIDCEIEIHNITNGYDAIYSLKQRSTADSPSLPDLAIVDLDLPGKNGYEILEAIREEPQLQILPVIILTGSEDSGDIVRCYKANANAYITKPTDPDDFVSVMKAIKQFWFEHVQLPSINR